MEAYSRGGGDSRIHIKGLVNRINLVHKNTLLIVYHDKSSDFSTLLQNDHPALVHQ